MYVLMIRRAKGELDLNEEPPEDSDDDGVQVFKLLYIVVINMKTKRIN